jgi:uroporphyrinogen-III synthase
MNAAALRVAVTRDEAEDGPLSQALRRHMLEPVRCRVIEEAPPLDAQALALAAAELESFDWLVVASARAVAALAEARGGKPFPATLRCAAVGRKSAAALEAQGARDPLIAPAAGAGPLAMVLRDADHWPGKRVLLPHAAEGRPKLASALRRFGADVHEVVAYRTVELPAAMIAEAWGRAAAQAVVVASPSAARALIGAVGAASLRRLEPVVALGSTTAMTLVALGVKAVVPETADFDAVAELLRARRPPDAEVTT